MYLKYIIKKSDINKSINEILLREFHFSSRLLNKLIKNKLIFIYNNDCKLDEINLSLKLFIDTRTIINCNLINKYIIIDLGIKEDNSNIIPVLMNLDIIYEDDWLIVINKPYGLPVHPSAMHYSNSLSNGVKYYFDSIGLNKKIRPVNRIDKNTSGIVVFAKCEYVQEELIRQMSVNSFEKSYLCLVEGHLNLKEGSINYPISRKPNSIIEREVNINGKESITYYKVIKEFNSYSLVSCKLETGRTHQIRVHMSYIGHPLLGDSLYGNDSYLISRQALHSYKISFVHPISKKNLSFTASIPDDFRKLL